MHSGCELSLATLTWHVTWLLPPWWWHVTGAPNFTRAIMILSKSALNVLEHPILGVQLTSTQTLSRWSCAMNHSVSCHFPTPSAFIETEWFDYGKHGFTVFADHCPSAFDKHNISVSLDRVVLECCITKTFLELFIWVLLKKKVLNEFWLRLLGQESR